MSALSKFSKKLRWSKTFWVNFLTGAVSAITAATGLTFLPPEFVSYLVTALAVVNIFLRRVTSKPISGV